MTPPTPDERQRDLLGLVVFAIGGIMLFDTVRPDGGLHLLRYIVGQGAIPVAIAISFSGLIVGLRRIAAPVLGKHWYPEALLGLYLSLWALLVALHLRLGPDSYSAIARGKGGGIIGWAFAGILLSQ